MKVVIIQRSGYTDRRGAAHQCGAEAEFSDDLALKLIRYGIAAPLREERVETVAVQPPETTARHTTKPSRKTRPEFSPMKEPGNE